MHAKALSYVKSAPSITLSIIQKRDSRAAQPWGRGTGGVTRLHYALPSPTKN